MNPFKLRPEDERALLNDYSHSVTNRIDQHGDEPNFPNMEKFGFDRYALDDYLFDKQAILDSPGSTRTQLTQGGIMLTLPLIVLSAFPDDKITEGIDPFFFGLGIGIVLLILWRIIIKIIIYVRLKKINRPEIEDYIEEVLNYN